MAEYYLISQLPALEGLGENAMPPITEDRFLELCRRFLSKKACDELDRLTLVPPKESEKSNSALVEAWNDGERELRFALAKARAERMKKPFDTENRTFSPELVKAVNTAIAAESPMEAEKLLDAYRLEFLESLRPTDPFSEAFVFFYALKLKLLLRIRQFDTSVGEQAYRNIYHSILDGERPEVLS